MEKFSAKLIYQLSGFPKEHGRWLYEERIVCFLADGKESAYHQACLIAKKNTYPGYRFVGVASIIAQYPIMHENEVWYELRTSSNPKKLVPSKPRIS